MDDVVDFVCAFKERFLQVLLLAYFLISIFPFDFFLTLVIYL